MKLILSNVQAKNRQQLFITRNSFHFYKAKTLSKKSSFEVFFRSLIQEENFRKTINYLTT